MRTPLLIIDVDVVGDSKSWETVIRAKRLDGSTAILRVNGCTPKFWTAKPKAEHGRIEKIDGLVSVKDTDFTSIDGIPLQEVICRSPFDIREVRDFFYPHYSADVKWSSLVRWIHGWTAVIEVEETLDFKDLRPINIHPSDIPASDFKLDLLYFDIETADSLDTENTPEPIVSIAIYNATTGVHEIGTICPTSERMVKKFLSSQEALESVVEHENPIPPIDSDKVVLYNLESEEDLIKWFSDSIKKHNPDVLAGQNIKSYDIPYFVHRARKLGMNMYYIKKMPTFDSKIAYAEQVQGSAQTTGQASLSWLAHETLGYGKVPRTKITDLMKNDPMMLAVYNIWDNVCAERSMAKLDLLPFYIMKTAYHNSTLHNSHSNMMLVEDMMGHLLMGEKIIMPSIKLLVENYGGEGIEQGGFVMEAPVGVWRNAFELDNSMEYPSAIITGNFSPDTKVNPSDYPDGYPFPVSKTHGGRVYRRDRVGIMPRILRELASARQDLKNQMKVETDPTKLMILDRQQRVMKENMNSWYGVLGSGKTEKTKNRPFRLADADIGSDITEIARLHNDWNKEFIDRHELWFSKEGVLPDEIEGVECFAIKFKTLYQDTDSCKVSILNHDELEKQVRPFEEEDIVNMADILCHKLNNSFHEFTKLNLNVPKNEFFNIKPDAFYKRYFQWGVKKRYAYLDYGGKKGFRGVEIRRSSTPTVVKDVQKQLFDTILNGGDSKEVAKVIREAVERLKDPAQTPSISFGQPFGLKKKGTSAYKSALWSNQNLGTEFDLGDKPCIFFAKDSPKGIPANRRVAIEWGDSPDDYGVVVDRDLSIETFFAQSNSFKAILGALGTDWSRCLSGVGVNSLDKWFS